MSVWHMTSTTKWDNRWDILPLWWVERDCTSSRMTTFRWSSRAVLSVRSALFSWIWKLHQNRTRKFREISDENSETFIKRIEKTYARDSSWTLIREVAEFESPGLAEKMGSSRCSGTSSFFGNNSVNKFRTCTVRLKVSTSAWVGSGLVPVKFQRNLCVHGMYKPSGEVVDGWETSLLSKISHFCKSCTDWFFNLRMV